MMNRTHKPREVVGRLNLTKVKVWLIGTLLYCVTINTSTVIEGAIIAGVVVIIATPFLR